jgi:Bacterial extracellular solute-binding protein
MEGARVVIDGPGATPIHVWSPASSAYRDAFERDWHAKHGNNPILKSENLALTPTVFVMRESRQQPDFKRYGKPSFRTVGEAMLEPKGWESIARQPDWGRFKFGHTHPNLSNSGSRSIKYHRDSFASWSDTDRKCFKSSFVSFRYCVLVPSKLSVLRV